MKVLHFHRWSVHGGAERYVADLCGAMARRGHPASVAASRAGCASGSEEDLEVCLVDQSFGLRSGIRMRKRVEGIVENWSPDLVHLHDTNCFLSPLVVERIRRKRPVIQTLHAGFCFCPVGRKILPDGSICPYPAGTRCLLEGCLRKGDLAYGLLILWWARTARSLDAVVVPSRSMMDEAVRNGVPPGKIEVIHPFTRKNPDDEYRSPEERSILFVGRTDPLKGMPQLLEALSLIRRGDWKAYIVGGGDRGSGGEGRAGGPGTGRNITFLGNLPHTELDSWYRRASIVVFPSMCPESFGLVGIEAMSFGRPVVAFDVGGPREWLADGETGYLVERGDTWALASALERLLDDGGLASRMGKAAMRRVRESFREEVHMARLLELYGRVSGKRAGRPKSH